MSDCEPDRAPQAVRNKLTKRANKGAYWRTTVRYPRNTADIAQTVSALSQFCNDPSSEHWTGAKRLLRYPKGTTNLGIGYEKNNEPMKCYVDADWANYIVDRRSYTGSAFISAGAAISWESRKQRTIAT